MDSNTLQKLPPEILTAIWEELANAPRIIEIQTAWIYFRVPDQFYKPPTVLQICHESRRVGLARFKHVRVYRHDIDDSENEKPPPHNNKMWLNPESDICYIGPGALKKSFLTRSEHSSFSVYTCRNESFRLTRNGRCGCCRTGGETATHILRLESFLPCMHMKRVACWDAVWCCRSYPVENTKSRIRAMFPNLEGDVMAVVGDTISSPGSSSEIALELLENGENKKWLALRKCEEEELRSANWIRAEFKTLKTPFKQLEYLIPPRKSAFELSSSRNAPIDSSLATSLPFFPPEILDKIWTQLADIPSIIELHGDPDRVVFVRQKGAQQPIYRTLFPIRYSTPEVFQVCSSSRAIALHKFIKLEIATRDPLWYNPHADILYFGINSVLHLHLENRYEKFQPNSTKLRLERFWDLDSCNVEVGPSDNNSLSSSQRVLDSFATEHVLKIEEDAWIHFPVLAVSRTIWGALGMPLQYHLRGMAGGRRVLVIDGEFESRKDAERCFLWNKDKGHRCKSQEECIAAAGFVLVDGRLETGGGKKEELLWLPIEEEDNDGGERGAEEVGLGLAGLSLRN